MWKTSWKDSARSVRGQEPARLESVRKRLCIEVSVGKSVVARPFARGFQRRSTRRFCGCANAPCHCCSGGAPAMSRPLCIAGRSACILWRNNTVIRLSPISRPSDLPVLNPLAELKPEPASPPGGPAELPLARGRERSAGSGEPGRCMPRLSASRTTGPIARSGRGVRGAPPRRRAGDSPARGRPVRRYLREQRGSGEARSV